jgi:hypothetical protein
MTPMLEPTKPHILNLKKRIKIAFTHAHDHCNFHFGVLDVGGEEDAYLLKAREFAAALNLLDRLVRDDRFLSPQCLQDCRHALVWYLRKLEDEGYRLKSREIGDLVTEIDSVAESFG